MALLLIIVLETGPILSYCCVLTLQPGWVELASLQRRLTVLLTVWGDLHCAVCATVTVLSRDDEGCGPAAAVCSITR